MNLKILNCCRWRIWQAEA